MIDPLWVVYVSPVKVSWWKGLCLSGLPDDHSSTTVHNPERLKSSLNHPKLIAMWEITDPFAIRDSNFDSFPNWILNSNVLGNEYGCVLEMVEFKFPTYCIFSELTAALLYDCFFGDDCLKSMGTTYSVTHTKISWLQDLFQSIGFSKFQPFWKVKTPPLRDGLEFGRWQEIGWWRLVTVDDGWWRLMTVDDGSWWSLMKVDDVGVIFGWQPS